MCIDWRFVYLEKVGPILIHVPRDSPGVPLASLATLSLAGGLIPLHRDERDSHGCQVLGGQGRCRPKAERRDVRGESTGLSHPSEDTYGCGDLKPRSITARAQRSQVFRKRHHLVVVGSDGGTAG